MRSSKLQSLKKKTIIIIKRAHRLTFESVCFLVFCKTKINKTKFEGFCMLTWLGRASFTRVPPRFSNGCTASQSCAHYALKLVMTHAIPNFCVAWTQSVIFHKRKSSSRFIHLWNKTQKTNVSYVTLLQNCTRKDSLEDASSKRFIIISTGSPLLWFHGGDNRPFKLCMFCFSIADRVTLPQTTVPFKCRAIHVHMRA